MRNPAKTQFCGCLIGQCLADAIGFLREGWPREDCEEYVAGLVQSWFEGKVEEEDCCWQYTDDSQLARELMQSYVDCKGFDPEDYARRIAAIFVEDRIMGRGIATHNAAMRLAEGVSWQEAGSPPPYAGNGAAMRAAPIGLLFDNPTEMIRAAYDQGWITHQDPRATAGGVAIAGAVHMAARQESIDRTAFVAQLVEWTAPIDVGFSSCVRELEGCWGLSVKEAINRFADLGLEEGRQNDTDGISPFVVPSVLWSLYAFLRTPTDYKEAISTAIRVGGDLHTTGAMTGAICGAHVGLTSLPAHLARLVNDRATWGYDELVSLADRSFDISTSRS